MSKSEDYLDDLLNAVSGRNDRKDITDLLDSVREDEERASRQQKNKKKKRDYGAEYYRDFLKELENDEEDEFIRNFELEIDAEEAQQEISEEDMAKEAMGEYDNNNEAPAQEGFDGNIGSIEGIVNEAKKRLSDEETANPEFSAGMQDDSRSAEESLENFMLGEEPFADYASEPLEPSQEGLEKTEDLEPDVDALLAEAGFGSDLDALLPEGDFGADEALLSEDMLSLEPESGEEQQLRDDEEQIRDESKLDEDGAADGDDGLLDLLSGLTDDSELSDIGALLKADADEEDLSELEKLESIDALADLGEAKKTGKNKKKGKKKDGKMSKFMSLLFGEDDTSKVKVAEEGSLENISDENMEILQEIDAKDKKSKKKEKKEKKEKTKKEKPEKPKKEKKPPKPKKEKKPKEPDLSPPLPKKPVILITVMAASMFALIMLGSNFVNYSNDVSAAKDLYKQGGYVEAYSIISGMNVKDAELEMYQNCAVLAMVQEEYLAYMALMDREQYQFALDALIRGVGRSDRFHEKAEEYGIIPELEQLGVQLEQVLNEQFGVSKEQALELYQLQDRTDYSVEVLKILDSLGLE